MAGHGRHRQEAARRRHPRVLPWPATPPTSSQSSGLGLVGRNPLVVLVILARRAPWSGRLLAGLWFDTVADKGKPGGSQRALLSWMAEGPPGLALACPGLLRCPGSPGYFRRPTLCRVVCEPGCSRWGDPDWGGGSGAAFQLECPEPGTDPAWSPFCGQEYAHTWLLIRAPRGRKEQSLHVWVSVRGTS